jgi:hypothetical protein
MSVTYLDGGATLSACRTYRYFLWRQLSESSARMLFVMLNPSTADETKPDPTMTRCAGFAAREGCGRFGIVNLWAFRSKNPRALERAPDPVGPDNGSALVSAAAEHDRIVCAWGVGVHHVLGWENRVRDVLDLLGAWDDLLCFGVCRDGRTPRHPLMLRADTPLVELP